MNTDNVRRKFAVRSYYFAEAMAIYDLYYRPIIETYAPARAELLDQGRGADRPPTWVPLVFHCTTIDRVAAIVERGAIEPGRDGTVSFSELPIGELDRMKYRHGAAEQVAFGFPRRFLEFIGFAPVLYAKHHPKLREVLQQMRSKQSDLYAGLAPFLEIADDVAAFQELRTTAPVSIEHAVWLLSTKLHPDTQHPDIPAIDVFRERYGRISTSYWHRTHQMKMLKEWQFVRLEAGERQWPSDFDFLGEHYWYQNTRRTTTLNVWTPKHERALDFEFVNALTASRYTGPWHFVDVARMLFDVLRQTGADIDQLLPYRLIREFDDS